MLASSLAAKDSLVVATWNVENLFDTVLNQAGGTNDFDFTPASWRRWTPERYNAKLTHLAWVIDKMSPDILFLSEIENFGVLKDLNERILKNHAWNFAAIAHFESGDPRGIDVAIFSRYPVASTNLVSLPGRRGTLVAEIMVEGESVWCLANHWKSQVGNMQENIVVRTQEAMMAREEAMKILRPNPNATIIIAGDFNEDADGPSVTAALGAVTNRTQVASIAGSGRLFYNVLGDVSKENHKDVPGSYYYARRKAWNTFDMIIVQPKMLFSASEAGPAWRVPPQDKHATKTFALPEMRADPDGRPKSYRRVRIKSMPPNYYEEGYSDHFPVITTFIKGRK